MHAVQRSRVGVTRVTGEALRESVATAGQTQIQSTGKGRKHGKDGQVSRARHQSDAAKQVRNRRAMTRLIELMMRLQRQEWQTR